MAKRGTVTFVADGQEYSARLSTNAMIRYEDRANESILKSLGDMENGTIDFRRLRAIFHVCLEGEYSEEEVGDLMDEIGLERTGEVLNDVIRAAFPEAEEASAGNGAAGKVPARKGKAKSAT